MSWHFVASPAHPATSVLTTSHSADFVFIPGAPCERHPATSGARLRRAVVRRPWPGIVARFSRLAVAFYERKRLQRRQLQRRQLLVDGVAEDVALQALGMAEE